MTETPQERQARQFKNFEWRHGRGEPVYNDPETWEMPYRDSVIMDQALDKRSQHEWFAKAVWVENAPDFVEKEP